MPVLSLSRTHSRAYLKSSQVSGWPSDHFRPSRSVQVTVIASPPSPGTLTPPLAVVGIVLGEVRRVLVVVGQDDERRPGGRGDVGLGDLARVERVELVGFLPVADDDLAAVVARPRACTRCWSGRSPPARRAAAGGRRGCAGRRPAARSATAPAWLARALARGQRRSPPRAAGWTGSGHWLSSTDSASTASRRASGRPADADAAGPAAVNRCGRSRPRGRAWGPTGVGTRPHPRRPDAGQGTPQRDPADPFPSTARQDGNAHPGG